MLGQTEQDKASLNREGYQVKRWGGEWGISEFVCMHWGGSWWVVSDPPRDFRKTAHTAIPLPWD